MCDLFVFTTVTYNTINMLPGVNSESLINCNAPFPFFIVISPEQFGYFTFFCIFTLILLVLLVMSSVWTLYTAWGWLTDSTQVREILNLK